jgi:type I restriction enzyme S subunit
MSSNEWKNIKLGELCTKIGSGATPRGGKETYLEEGPYALVRSQNILDFFFSFDGIAYISDNQANQLSNVELQEKDVLLNITGDSVARVCQILKEVLPARVNQHVSIIRPDCSRLNPEYLKYFLLNPKFKNHMLGLASVGGTRNALTKGMIEDFEIVLPPLQIQHLIAEILSSLDDKIELNRQTNATLEAIAQAIFKEWFVDFNFPGATREMVDSELGMIPKGWQVKTFEEELVAERGLSYKGICLEIDNATPMHNLNSVYEGGGYKFEGIKYYSGDYKEKHVIKPGDLIIANTEQGHKYLLIGYPAIVPALFGEIGIYSHHIYRVRPKHHSYLTSDYLYELLLQPSIRDQVIGFANGTTVNMLRIEGLQKPKFILSSQDLVAKFSQLAFNARIKQEENIKESATLAAIRDALLPKLMSGEIEV